ncbi:single-stranded DNA-binding protein [Bifidobacterium platyrrhinorum]|uniref:Single-stranded DNA-binding protein n=1 Tax=Bifidobacterium platyrrhinorum TaxID=2661628 RepID=A0A6L9SUC9_9BIFI|nr:single-stranded DNA-binding protein [Bifidobacterium platyrrhinorum]NEG56158.1 single-stranded DNA-binding protein [Bifidobacterium platyrrhinorum]
MALDPSIAVIRGRLAADPELRTTRGGANVASFRVLSSGWERDTAGQRVDVTPTSWQCEAWRDLADHIGASLVKGSQVIITAHPRTDHYQTRDGADRWATRWVVDDIGASLKTATVQITRTRRDHTPGPSTPPASAPAPNPTGPATDPFAGYGQPDPGYDDYEQSDPEF